MSTILYIPPYLTTFVLRLLAAAFAFGGSVTLFGAGLGLGSVTLNRLARTLKRFGALSRQAMFLQMRTSTPGRESLATLVSDAVPHTLQTLTLRLSCSVFSYDRNAAPIASGIFSTTSFTEAQLSPRTAFTAAIASTNASL